MIILAYDGGIKVLNKGNERDIIATVKEFGKEVMRTKKLNFLIVITPSSLIVLKKKNGRIYRKIYKLQRMRVDEIRDDGIDIRFFSFLKSLPDRKEEEVKADDDFLLYA